MLDLITVVWGDQYAQLYCDAGLRSLMQPDNIPAVADSIGEYTFFADEQARRTIEGQLAYREMARKIYVEWRALYYGDREVNSYILDSMKRSLGVHLFSFPADIALSNGSLKNIVKLSKDYELIVYGFPKITVDGWGVLVNRFRKLGVLDSRKMVAIWSIHDAGSPIDIKKVEPDIWRLAHHTPTPIMKIDQKVIDFFELNDTSNQGYDHCIPIWMIENGYSWYLVRDSDEVFQLEGGGESWENRRNNHWMLDYIDKATKFFRAQEEVWHA